MKWQLLAVLIIGIVFGGGVGFLIRAQSTSFSKLIVPALATTETAFSGEEDYTALDDSAEHAAIEKEATTQDESFHGTVSGAASATSSLRSKKIPVLIYHSVRAYIKGESKYQDAYDVTPELLESELHYIKENGYTTITFADVTAYFDQGTPLPEKPVILSFDDGWKNQYEHAFPLLQKYDMKGTFFIYTNPIDHNKAHWMSWDEVRALDAAGMEIAGHSRTHPILTKITTDAGLDKEISGGKHIIEKEIGHPISIFAYPFGMHDDRVVAAVKRAGYVLARTVYSGVWDDPEHAFEFHGTLASDKLSDFVKLLNEQ